jgi:Putative peptidoglycan binding domain
MKNNLISKIAALATIAFIAIPVSSFASVVSVPSVDGSQNDTSSSSVIPSVDGSQNTGDTSDASSSIPTSDGSQNTGGSSAIPNNDGSQNTGGDSAIPPVDGSQNDDTVDTSSSTTTSTGGGSGTSMNPTVVTQSLAVSNGAPVSTGGSASTSPVVSNSSTTTAPAVTTTAPVEPLAACNLITNPLSITSQNDPVQVTLLQQLLNKFENAGLTVNGTFDQATLAAVKAFQLKYQTDVLAPWGSTLPSGFVYITTRKKLNELNCNAAQPLTAGDLAIINAYKQLTAGGNAGNPTVGTTSPVIGTNQNPTQPAASTTNQFGANTTTNPNQPQTASVLGAITNTVGNFFKSVGNSIGNFFKKIF